MAENRKANQGFPTPQSLWVDDSRRNDLNFLSQAFARLYAAYDSLYNQTIGKSSLGDPSRTQRLSEKLIANQLGATPDDRVKLDKFQQLFSTWYTPVKEQIPFRTPKRSAYDPEDVKLTKESYSMISKAVIQAGRKSGLTDSQIKTILVRFKEDCADEGAASVTHCLALDRSYLTDLLS
jgi:hypothetical protein